MSGSDLLASTLLEVLSRAVGQGKERKGIQTVKDNANLPLISDTVYISSQNPQKNITANKMSCKIQGLYKNINYIYTLVMNKSKIKKTIPFVIASKRNKILRSTFNKVNRKLCSGNYKKTWKT